MRYVKFSPPEETAKRMRAAGLSRDRVVADYFALDSYPEIQRAFGAVFGIAEV